MILRSREKWISFFAALFLCVFSNTFPNIWMNSIQKLAFV